MSFSRWLGRTIFGTARVHDAWKDRPSARCHLRLERLEDRYTPAGGFVDWAEVENYGYQPPPDSLSPASPSTTSVIDFVLHDDEPGDVYGTQARLSFDVANKTIDVVFDPGPPMGYGGFYVQGVYGQLWSLDPGIWTLNGPKSSITFTVAQDPVLSLAVSDVEIAEGSTGTTNAIFNVRLSAASDQTVTVNYAAGDGSAQASAGDYVPTSGFLTFAPGEITKAVTVLVNADTRDEYEEYFHFNLSNSINAVLPPYGFRATILDDDVSPSATIADVARSEGQSGNTSFVFTVSLSEATDKWVSVRTTTGDGTAQASSSDYVPRYDFVGFAPGQTTATFTIAVRGDTRDEPDETFVVDLINAGHPSDVLIADGQGIGTILNDDPRSLTINDDTRAEGNSGTGYSVFTVTLSSSSNTAVSVEYATGDGTAKAGNDDYLPTTGTLIFAPGETTKTITVPVKGDTRDEFDETFVVNLLNSTNATLADGQGVGSIVDDDPPPALSINDVTRSEGRSGVTYFVFTVTLSAASDKVVTVNFATANGTATTANNDYVAASGTLTFAPGETTKTITVEVKGDRTKEANESFFLNLSGALDALIADSQGRGTILNDD